MPSKVLSLSSADVPLLLMTPLRVLFLTTLLAAGAALEVQAAVVAGAAALKPAQPTALDDSAVAAGPAAAGPGPVAAATEADHSIRWVVMDASPSGGNCESACARRGLAPIQDEQQHSLCAWRYKKFDLAYYNLMYNSGARRHAAKPYNARCASLAETRLAVPSAGWMNTQESGDSRCYFYDFESRQAMRGYCMPASNALPGPGPAELVEQCPGLCGCADLGTTFWVGHKTSCGGRRATNTYLTCAKKVAGLVRRCLRPGCCGTGNTAPALARLDVEARTPCPSQIQASGSWFGRIRTTPDGSQLCVLVDPKMPGSNVVFQAAQFSKLCDAKRCGVCGHGANSSRRS